MRFVDIVFEGIQLSEELNPGYIDGQRILLNMAESSRRNRDLVLYESSKNVTKYVDFIKKHRNKSLQFSSLVIGQKYCPISLYSSPDIEDVQYIGVSLESELLSITSSMFLFDTPSKKFGFPISDNKILASAIQDTLIFDDIGGIDKMIFEMQFVFGNWAGLNGFRL